MSQLIAETTEVRDRHRFDVKTLEDYLREHWVAFASVAGAILFLVAAFGMWEHYRRQGVR